MASQILDVNRIANSFNSLSTLDPFSGSCTNITMTVANKCLHELYVFHFSACIGSVTECVVRYCACHTVCYGQFSRYKFSVPRYFCLLSWVHVFAVRTGLHTCDSDAGWFTHPIEVSGGFYRVGFRSVHTVGQRGSNTLRGFRVMNTVIQ